MSALRRHQTIPVRIGTATVGGTAPIIVQSMTNTDTADVVATATQVAELYRAGSEMVRITVNSQEAAEQVAELRRRLDGEGLAVPLIGDFHYNGHVLLRKFPDCAAALDKYRINPGNVGKGASHDKNFATMIEVAREFDKAVRIGVNAGSLDQELLNDLMEHNARALAPQSAQDVFLEAMVQSALRSAHAAEELGLRKERIVLSCKISKVQELVKVYRLLAARCDYALHLGLTEAGMGMKGIVASAAGLSILLQEGIGDTIRVSLTPEPGGDRTNEVVVAQEILQTMGLRAFTPLVTACPGCGRTTSTVFQELASDIQAYVRTQMPIWKSIYPGVEEMTLAVMGCVVNGPGESKHANIGISLPGSGETPAAPVFVDGEKFTILRGDNIAGEFKQILDNYIVTHYGHAAVSHATS